MNAIAHPSRLAVSIATLPLFVLLMAFCLSASADTEIDTAVAVPATETHEAEPFETNDLGLRSSKTGSQWSQPVQSSPRLFAQLIQLDSFESCDCDDGLVCTADFCSGSEECINDGDAMNGTPCDDGDLCTVAAMCDGGECSGLPKDCTDGNFCTVDFCIPGTGQCDNDPVPLNGTPCDDGDLCTVAAMCDGGECSGLPKDCTDGNFCTVDFCVPGTGQCDNDPVPLNGMPCDDGNPGTIGDMCNAGVCMGDPV